MINLSGARRVSVATSLTPLIIGVALLTGAVVGTLPARQGALAVAGLGALLATLVSPLIGLGMVLLAVPFAPSRNETAGGLPVTATDALVALVLVVVAVALLTRRMRTLDLTRAFWPGVAFICVSMISASAATQLLVSAKGILRWVEIIGLIVVAANVARTGVTRRQLLYCLFVALAAEAAVGWVQFLARIGPPSFRIGPFLRAYGTFGQPNPFGGYLELGLPIAVAVALRRRPGRWILTDPLSLAALAALALAGPALLMSLSRGAWLGFGAAIGVLYAQRGRRQTIAVLGACIVFLAILLGRSSHLLPGVIGARLDQITEYFGVFDVNTVTLTPANFSIVERMAHWQAAWNMYLSHPLFGVGPDHYAVVYRAYRANATWANALGHAHNFYLNVMAEQGFFGIVAYAIMLASWVLLIGGGWRRASAGSVDQALAAGVLAAFVAIAIHNVVDNLYVHGMNAQLGLLIGLAAAIGRFSSNPTTEAL